MKNEIENKGTVYMQLLDYLNTTLDKEYCLFTLFYLFCDLVEEIEDEYNEEELEIIIKEICNKYYLPEEFFLQSIKHKEL